MAAITQLSVPSLSLSVNRSLSFKPPQPNRSFLVSIYSPQHHRCFSTKILSHGGGGGGSKFNKRYCCRGDDDDGYSRPQTFSEVFYSFGLGLLLWWVIDMMTGGFFSGFFFVRNGKEAAPKVT